jgi:hypothetical protein
MGEVIASDSIECSKSCDCQEYRVLQHDARGASQLPWDSFGGQDGE